MEILHVSIHATGSICACLSGRATPTCVSGTRFKKRSARSRFRFRGHTLNRIGAFDESACCANRRPDRRPPPPDARTACGTDSRCKDRRAESPAPFSPCPRLSAGVAGDIDALRSIHRRAVSVPRSARQRQPSGRRRRRAERAPNRVRRPVATSCPRVEIMERERASRERDPRAFAARTDRFSGETIAPRSGESCRRFRRSSTWGASLRHGRKGGPGQPSHAGPGEDHAGTCQPRPCWTCGWSSVSEPV